MAEDLDTQATREWLDALDSVLEFQGATQANFLLDSLISEALRKGAPVPYSATTPYLNTIPMLRQEPYPGDLAVERRIRSMIRWNAAAIVLRANKTSSELGGHIASFQSAATLYDVGFQHFWHAPSESHGGDLVYIQATARRENTRGRSSRGGWTRGSWIGSGRRRMGAGCRRIRIRG
jgi:pyruvate dehydrogenase E1 component